MTLWLSLIVLCSFAAVAISIPLIRHYESGHTPSQDTAVYQDQLREVERDLQSGSINTPEAQAAKLEINRRLEAATRSVSTAQPLAAFWRRVSLALAASMVIIGGVGLYGYMGSPNMPSAVPPTAQQQQQAQSNAAVDDIVGKLQVRLKTNPDDAETWRMLGWVLFKTQHWQESTDAYAKALALAPNNTDYKSAMLESVVQGAQGMVIPKAQELIADVLAKDPKDLRARFYDALGHEQAGDKQGAFDRWSALLADAPADAGWREDVTKRIADLAKALGKVEPSSNQQAMIDAMVQRLADKLRDNPKDIDGWLKLMRSYTVLKMPEKAKAALASAQKAFEAEPATLDILKAMALELEIK